MNDTQKVYIWLSTSELDLAVLNKLIENYPNIDNLLKINKYEGEITKFLSGAEFSRLWQEKESVLPETLATLQKGKIKYICRCDESYPSAFLGLDYPPFVIYYVGNISLLETKGLAILGSRLCTRYGKEQTERFTRAFIEAGYTLINGLSDGIETFACTEALNSNGNIIVIMANGLNSIYPAFNTMLARSVIKAGGLIISEKAPDYKPRGMAFVQRNRLIAHISEAVLVTEAGENSGALHTVNFALDYGKDIFVLPANCNSPTSAGSNNLIKQYYSTCVTEPEEIFNKLNGIDIRQQVQPTDKKKEVLEKREPIKPPKQVKKVDAFEQEMNLNDLERLIVDFIKYEDKHFDEIQEKTKIDTKKLIVLLTTLEIRGIIKKLPANFYRKRD